MATVYQEIPLDALPEVVWAAVRDVGAVHERLFPGYLTDARLEDGASVPTRVVTFASGLVVREHIIGVDDAARRVAWTAVGGRATHHNAAMQVRAERTPAGAERSVLVWVTDVLPDELAGPVRALVQGGTAVLRQAFTRPISADDAVIATTM